MRLSARIWQPAIPDNPRFRETFVRQTASDRTVLTLKPGLVMLANNLMLLLFYLVLVVPVLWWLRPAKLSTPF